MFKIYIYFLKFKFGSQQKLNIFNDQDNENEKSNDAFTFYLYLSRRAELSMVNHKHCTEFFLVIVVVETKQLV